MFIACLLVILTFSLLLLRLGLFLYVELIQQTSVVVDEWIDDLSIVYFDAN